MTDVKVEELSNDSKTDKYKHLQNFVNAVIDKNDDLASSEISAYSEIFAREKVASYKTSVTESEEGIKLTGDEVLVKGKVVGTIKNDTSKKDGKISFTSNGKVSTFKSLSDLYAHLVTEYKLSESASDFV